MRSGCIRNSPWKHPGVRSVLRSPGEGYRSEVVAALLPDLPNRKVTVYRLVLLVDDSCSVVPLEVR